MNLHTYIAQKAAERDQYYCPCCKDRLDRDDMDLHREWPHSQAMHDRYGAVCCATCTDDHVITADGVLMRTEDAVRGIDYLWSTQEAFDEALYQGRM